jgi:hypothetical protein
MQMPQFPQDAGQEPQSHQYFFRWAKGGSSGLGSRTARAASGPAQHGQRRTAFSPNLMPGSCPAVGTE